MKNTHRYLRHGILAGILVLALACQGGGGGTSDSASEAPSPKGIGPVKSVKVGAIDAQKVTQGEQIFQSKCSMCHKLDEKYVGPPLRGVTKRRQPEWIMNMILNPVEMTQKDPVAQELLATFLVQMTYQNVTQDEARAILEFFRQSDAQAPGP